MNIWPWSVLRAVRNELSAERYRVLEQSEAMAVLRSQFLEALRRAERLSDENRVLEERVKRERRLEYEAEINCVRCGRQSQAKIYSSKPIDFANVKVPPREAST